MGLKHVPTYATSCRKRQTCRCQFCIRLFHAHCFSSSVYTSGKQAVTQAQHCIAPPWSWLTPVRCLSITLSSDTSFLPGMFVYFSGFQSAVNASRTSCDVRICGTRSCGSSTFKAFHTAIRLCGFHTTTRRSTFPKFVQCTPT